MLLNYNLACLLYSGKTLTDWLLHRKQNMYPEGAYVLLKL